MQVNIAKLSTDRTKVQEVFADANGRILTANTPTAAGTSVAVSSGNVANATATATLPATAGVTNYITGFVITACGATAAGNVTATVDGLVGGATLSYTFTFPAGITIAATPLVVNFSPPIPANAANTAINVSVPAAGAGNVKTAVSATGFRV